MSVCRSVGLLVVTGRFTSMLLSEHFFFRFFMFLSCIPILDFSAHFDSQDSIMTYICFSREAAIFSITIRPGAKPEFRQTRLSTKTRILKQRDETSENFCTSVSAGWLVCRSHLFQIHENAVYPYKPHQSTARICKGVLCPASCLFVPIRA